MRSAFLLTLIVVNSCAPGVQAQQIFNSLIDVWKYTLQNNPGNKRYQLQVNVAEQDKKAASGFRYPKVSASFSGQRNVDISETPVPGELVGKPGETVYLKFDQNYSYNAGLTITKSILDWQSIHQQKIAKVNVALKTTEKQYFEQVLKEQVAQIYYATLTANEAVAIGRKDLVAVDSIFYIACDRFNQGLIDALTLNQAKIKQHTVYEKLEQSKLYQAQCIYNLKLLMGLEPGDSVWLTEKVDFSGEQQEELKLIASNLYTDVFRLQVEISGYDVKKARARFLPKIDYMHFIGGTQFRNNLALSFNSSDWNSSNYIGLSLSVPIFSGLTTKSQYKAARISQQIAKATFEDEVRKLAINDSILFNGYLTAINLAKSSSESFKISGNNLELIAQKYSKGLVGLSEYLEIFGDYLAAESQYLSRISDYLVNRATLEARK